MGLWQDRLTLGIHILFRASFCIPPLLPRYSNLEYVVFQGLHVLYLGCCEVDCPLGDALLVCQLRANDIESQTLKLRAKL